MKEKQLLYKDEGEMSAEISRMVMLNDTDGLKIRFGQLYKERDMVLSHAKSQLTRFEPLEAQK